MLRPATGEAAQDLCSASAVPRRRAVVYFTIWSYCWRIRSQSIVFVDSSVYRTGPAAARRSEGYSFAPAPAPARPPPASPTRPRTAPAVAESPRTRWSLFTSASRLSSPSASGSAFSSVKNVPPAPALSASVPASSAIGSSSRDRVSADSRPTVAARNRSSKVLTALPTSPAIWAPRGWRLQPVVAAAGHHRLREPVPVQLHPAQLDLQPLGELGLVLLGALTEAERAPDLHSVPLDRPPRPVVRGPLLGGHPHLLSDVRHRRYRDIPGVLREPGLHLEELQQGARTPTGSPPTCSAAAPDPPPAASRPRSSGSHSCRTTGSFRSS